MLQTHFYDGKLELINIKKQLDYIDSIPTLDKKKSFQELREKINPYFTETSISFFDNLVGNLSYDSINNLNPQSLLYMCFLLSQNKNINHSDLFTIMNIQFEDMATGFCPQGQTIRLFQIVKSFSDI